MPKKSISIFCFLSCIIGFFYFSTDVHSETTSDGRYENGKATEDAVKERCQGLQDQDLLKCEREFFALRLGKDSDDCSEAVTAANTALRDFKSSCAEARVKNCNDDNAFEGCVDSLNMDDDNAILGLASPILTAMGNNGVSQLFNTKQIYNAGCSNMTYEDWKSERDKNQQGLDDVQDKILQTQRDFTTQSQELQSNGISSQESSAKIQRQAAELPLSLSETLSNIKTSAANKINKLRTQIQQTRSEIARINADIAKRELQKSQEVEETNLQCERQIEATKSEFSSKSQTPTSGTNGISALSARLKEKISKIINSCVDKVKSLKAVATKDIDALNSKQDILQSQVSDFTNQLQEAQDQVQMDLSNAAIRGDLAKQDLRDQFIAERAKLESIQKAQKAGEDSMKQQLSNLTMQAQRYQNNVFRLGTHAGVGATKTMMEAMNDKDYYKEEQEKLGACCWNGGTKSLSPNCSNIAKPSSSSTGAN